MSLAANLYQPFLWFVFGSECDTAARRLPLRGLGGATFEDLPLVPPGMDLLADRVTWTCRGWSASAATARPASPRATNRPETRTRRSAVSPSTPKSTTHVAERTAPRHWRPRPGRAGCATAHA